MRFSYQFANLCGTVYHQGNVVFTADGNTLVSPVGNRVTVFDLVRNTAATLPFENRKNIDRIALSPNDRVLITVDEDGRALLVNFFRRVVLHHFNFKERVRSIKFAPNGRYFAVTHGRQVQLWRTPTLEVDFAPFVLHRTYAGHDDEVMSIEWAADSSLFLTTSRDMTARIWTTEPVANYQPPVLGGHRDVVVAGFFSKDAKTVYTVSKDGALYHWALGTEEAPAQGRRSAHLWTLVNRHFFREGHSKVSVATFHVPSSVLVIGFSSGVFGLYELPDCTNIHTLSISQNKVTACAINTSGEWLAFGSSTLGQLLVWEWQSESYILRQQGHAFPPTALAYSPEGQTIVTGGDDSRVKLWNVASGFCFVTFTEHSAPVTSVQFANSGQVVVSASKDGTVRAFDLLRYRNFRTFTTPKPLSLVSLALDSSGELVVAGSEDSFEIFLWSMQTGKLLDVLAGHEGPVTSLAFSPSQAGFLASGSWDKTVRVWDVFGGGRAKETLQHGADVLALAYRPDGHELAVATLDGNISLWDLKTMTQTGQIEARRDITGGRSVWDSRTAVNSTANKAFTSLCYTADGQCLLAGGASKFVCIYDLRSRLMLRRFELSHNRSLDGILDKLSNRDVTDAGAVEMLDLDDSEDERSADTHAARLPGAQRTDLSTRRFRPTVRAHGVRFSPTGQSFAVAATEGLVVFALDDFLSFDPLDLELELTPAAVTRALAEREYLKALVLAVRLNEAGPLEEVYEGVPVASVALVGRDLPRPYLERVLRTVAAHLEKAAHLEFNLRWVVALLGPHAAYIRQHRAAFAPTLRSLHKALQEQRDGLVRLADNNRFALDYLLSALRSETGGASVPPQADDAATATSGAAAAGAVNMDATTEEDGTTAEAPAAAGTSDSAPARPKKATDKRKRTVVADPEPEFATSRAVSTTTKRARKPDAASEAAASEGANKAASSASRPKTAQAVPAKAAQRPRSTAGTA